MTTLDSFINPGKKEENKVETKPDTTESSNILSEGKKEAIRVKNKKRKDLLEQLVPWTKKYLPKKIENIIGHKKELEKIKKFLNNFSKEKKKAILLWGASGVGKSMIPYTIAEAMGYEYIELNASDKRNKAIIEEQLGNILKQQSLFGTKKIVLIDDADGLSGMKDRGGASSIAKLAAESKFPIFITAQEPFEKKLSPLRSKSILIELQSLSTEEIIRALKTILDNESISYKEKDVKVIAEHSKGDLRAAIIDAQMLTIGKKELDLTLLEELTERLQNKDMQDALKQVFKGTANEALGAFDSVSEDADKITLWVDYNLPLEYTKKTDRARGYGYLSKINVFSSRIRRRQEWRFLSHIYALLSAGIASAKDESYPGQLQYKDNTRILKMWQAKMKYAKRDAIAQKIADATHSSKKTVINNFDSYKGFIPQIAEELELSDDEITWIKT